MLSGNNNQRTFFDDLWRRWWIFAVAVFAVFVGIVVYPPSRASDDQLKAHRRESEMMRRVEERCAVLPKPEAFEFVYKNSPDKYFRRVEVDYTFKTKRTEAEIFSFFVSALSADGWTPEEDPNRFLRFGKGGETVLIRPEYQPSYGYYLIRCIERTAE